MKISTSEALVPADLVAALARAGFSVTPGRPVRRTVLDTFDGRVAAAGLRLELRQAEEQELVLSGCGSPPAGIRANGLPRFAGDLPVGPFRARLAGLLGPRALLPTFTVTACEMTATKRDRTGKTRASVTLHTQVAVEGRAPLSLSHSIEIGEVAGYAAQADAARDLLAAWGLPAPGGDLVGMAAASVGAGLGGFDASPSVPLRRKEPAEPAFRRLLSHLADTIDATWQGTVDDVDPEFLHDLRVAVRRTRSVLAQGRRVLPEPVRRSSQEAFGWLGTATGRPRDLDVYLIGWDEYVAPLGPEVAGHLAPVHEHIRREARVAHEGLAAALRSARYRELMEGWRAWLAQPGAGGKEPEGAQPIGRLAIARTEAAQARLLARGRAIGPDSPAEDLHELRKDAKKLRYVLECFGSLYPAPPRKRFVQLLKALQDNLGEHQDAEVHVGELRAISSVLPGSVDPETLVAVGQLAEQLEGRRRAAREAFAERFAAYDSTHMRRSFERLLRSVRK